ncbi:MAG: molybdate ABC transporter substrate-binding protein [Verrucomicrobiota bacterium]
MSVVLSLCLLVSGCSSRNTRDDEAILWIHAASSLEELIRGLGDAFSEKNGIEVRYNFAGSNTLAQQIAGSRVSGIFVSADEYWTDFVVERRADVVDRAKMPFGNSLAVVTAHRSGIRSVEAPEALADLEVEYWVMGNPESVPAGRYARAWLESISLIGDDSLWAIVSDKISPTLSVRSAVAQVSRVPGSVGVVYRSDLLRFSKDLKPVYVSRSDDLPIITYYAVSLSGDYPKGGSEQRFEAFVEFLRTEPARMLIDDLGFSRPLSL